MKGFISILTVYESFMYDYKINLHMRDTKISF